MENYLLNGEELITQSPNNVVVLTTHRIRYHATTSAQAHLVSVMLEKVSSCEMRFESSPVLLLLGITLALLGSISLLGSAFGNNMLGVIGIAAGLIMVVLYAATAKHVVSIASDGGSRISFETKGMKRETVIGLINSLEKAKSERMMGLSKGVNAVYA